MRPTGVFIVLGLNVLSTFRVEAVRCFECDHLPSPALCNDITTCNLDQDCYVEEVITTGGIVVYNSGCVTRDRCSALNSLVGKRNSDITSCKVCCHGDLCNNEGCSKRAIPRDQRGPYCYSCDLMTKTNECDKVKICAKDEICLLHIPGEYLSYPTPVYRTECQSKDSCAVLPGRSGLCPPTCCDTDFCNDHCVNTTTTKTTTTTTTTTAALSSSPTTTTPTRTTTTKATTKFTTHISTEKSTRPTTTPVTKPTSQGPRCKQGFYHVPAVNFCLDTRNSYKTWSDARKDCQKDNGDLVVYKTDDERRAVKSYMDHVWNRHDDQFWVGFNDPNSDDHYVFVTGDKVDHYMWQKGQPDNTQEDCGRASVQGNMMWWDTRCDKLYPYVCQTKPIW